MSNTGTEVVLSIASRGVESGPELGDGAIFFFGLVAGIALVVWLFANRVMMRCDNCEAADHVSGHETCVMCNQELRPVETSRPIDTIAEFRITRERGGDVEGESR